MTPEEVHKRIKIIDGEKVFNDNLFLSHYGLTSLEPYNLSDIIVTGYFDCSDNKLTSLKGAPNKVDSSFWCDHNKLTSLEGLPETIGGSIWIEKEVLQRLYFTNPLVSLYLMHDKLHLI